jgi:hypothetical protein
MWISVTTVSQITFETFADMNHKIENIKYIGKI